MRTPTIPFQQQLKEAQQTVKTLDGERERLLREASVEEHKIRESQAKLAELGIKDPEKLTVDELVKLRDTTQAELERDLATVQTKITEAKGVLAEYNTAVQA
jgi:predicted RNase H-like nuclease (RuvC/YqgF family)